MTEAQSRTKTVNRLLTHGAVFFVAVVIGGLATDATTIESSSWAPIDFLLGCASVIALGLRDRRPVVVAMFAIACSAVAPFAAGAAIVSLFTVATHFNGRTLALVTIAYTIASVTSGVLFPDQELGIAGAMIVMLPMIAAALGWGTALRTKNQLIASLTLRAEQAEREQQLRSSEARREERMRIATDMHDSLAHRLSMLSLQAGALEIRPNGTADEVVRAAHVIRSTAHDALEDLRNVLGVLRTKPDAPADSCPLPVASQIPHLVADWERSGVTVSAQFDVDLEGVPPELGLNAYRIVQEGLTNAARYGDSRTDSPRLWITGSSTAGLTVRIVNSVSPDTGSVGPGSGFGLIGISERVQLRGGRIRTGIDEHGNFELEVWLPWTQR